MRRTQLPVARQAALGKDRLRHAGGGRHPDVALEDLAVERVLRVSPHEVGAHRADERLQRPDARPLADGVGERRLLRRQVGHEDVVHVAAVVDQEDDRRLRRDRRQARLVLVPEAHAVERPGDVAGEPVPDAEVHVGVERRHDLVRVPADPLHDDLARHRLLARLGLGGLEHLRVVEEPVDQDLALGQLEVGDPDLQPRVDLLEHAVDPAPQEPPGARDQEPVERDPRGEDRQQDGEPDGKLDRPAHGAGDPRASGPA